MRSLRPSLLPLLMGLLALVALCTPSSTFAQDGLQISISQDTFGGYYKPGSWFPVVVQVANQPSEGRPGDRSLDFNGSLIVQSSSSAGGSSQYNFRRDVSVPAFSTQQFVVYSRIRESLPVPPMLEVRTSSGRRVKADPVAALQSLPRNRALMVTVTDQMRRLYYPNPRGGASYIVEGNLAPGNLFDDWMGYDSVDVLVFPTWPEGRMTPRIRSAIEHWVAMGGTLVFLGGSNSAGYAAADDETLLPVRVSSASRYALDASRGVLRIAPPGEELGETPSVLLSNITPDSDAEVLLDLGTSENRIPAIVQRRIGNGRVLFIGTDFEGDSALARAALGPMWQSLMPLPDPVDWQTSLSDALKRTKTVTGAAARPPNLFLVIALCVIYTLVVGPINFLFLGMTKRIQWAWFTVPAIVLVFTALIYTIGVLTKGGQTISRENTILLGSQNDPRFESISAYSLFVQDAGVYRAIPDEATTAAADADPWHSSFFLTDSFTTTNILADAGSDGLGFAQRRPVIQSIGTGAQVESWPLRTYDTTQFLARGPKQLDGAVRSTLSLANQGSVWWLDGELVNETGLDFYATALVSGTRGLPLGALDDGQSMSLDRSTTRLWFSTGTIVLWRPWADFINGLTDRGDFEVDTDEALNRENAAVLLEHIARPYGVSSILPPLKGRVYFLGLAESKEITADLGTEADVIARSIVVLVELNPVPTTNSFVVHPELTALRLVNYPEDYRFRYESGQGLRGGFQQAFTGSTEPSIRLSQEANFVAAIELPFEHPNVRVQLATESINFEPNPVSALFSYSPLGLLTGGGRPISGPIQDPRGDFFTPGRGRGWIQFVAGSSGNQLSTESIGMRALNFELIGGIDR